MECYAGLDASISGTAICVVGVTGDVIREAQVGTTLDEIVAVLDPDRRTFRGVGVEATDVGRWIARGLGDQGIPCVCVETMHAHAYLRSRINKTDRNDARGLAELMRYEAFRPVHQKSEFSRDAKALLSARKILSSKIGDIERGIRGIVRGIGVNVGPVSAKQFDQRLRSLLSHNATWLAAIEPLLVARAALCVGLDDLTARVEAMAKSDPVCRRLMTAPGVGPIVALIYRSAVDDPHRFPKSSAVAAHFGLTPKTYQSGTIDLRGRISRRGDRLVRTALYQAAVSALNPGRRSSALRAWAQGVVERRGRQKGRVAYARRLAVVLHRMWVDGTDFRWEEAVT